MARRSLIPLALLAVTGCAERASIVGPSSLAPSAPIDGYVVDRSSGAPVAGAFVAVLAADQAPTPTRGGAVTDERGHFALGGATIGSRLLVRYIGYRPESIPVSEIQLGSGPLRISLEQGPIEASICVFLEGSPKASKSRK